MTEIRKERKGEIAMSAGHPGICLYVRHCLLGDAKLGLSDSIVRIHISRRVTPQAFWNSYLYLFREREATVCDKPEVMHTTVDGEDCEVTKGVEFPAYGTRGEVVGRKLIDVFFTDQALSAGAVCATIDQNGKVVGE